jgi:hypothetical protein
VSCQGLWTQQNEGSLSRTEITGGGAHRRRHRREGGTGTAHLRLDWPPDATAAQSQCRTTCETLALLKNPPVFARQANIANGPQQVNNGSVLNDGSSRAGISFRANKLLESSTHGDDLDTGTPRAAIVRDSAALAPVGKINGPTHTRRESARIAKRVSR